MCEESTDYDDIKEFLYGPEKIQNIFDREIELTQFNWWNEVDSDE